MSAPGPEPGTTRSAAANGDAQAASLAVAAGLITASRLGSRLLDDLGDGIRPASDIDAYHVQAIAHPLLAAGGLGRQAGWKIGCTTQVMQAYLGIDSPCAGAMFQANVWHGQHVFTVPGAARGGSASSARSPCGWAGTCPAAKRRMTPRTCRGRWPRRWRRMAGRYPPPAD